MLTLNIIVGSFVAAAGDAVSSGGAITSGFRRVGRGANGVFPTRPYFMKVFRSLDKIFVFDMRAVGAIMSHVVGSAVKIAALADSHSTIGLLAIEAMFVPEPSLLHRIF